MSISNIRSALSAYKQIESITQQEKPTQQTSGVGKKGFGEMLSEAVKEVDSLQQNADTKVEDLVLGKGTVTPHDAMIALEKADVAFQLMNTVRSRIIRVYEEVMRSQV